MKAHAVQKYFTLIQSESVRAENIAVRLRKAGVLPKGGRGLNSPSITLQQAIQYMCAQATAEKYQDAAELAIKIPNFLSLSGKTLGYYLEELFQDESRLVDLDHLLFINLTSVRVVWKSSDKDIEFFLPSQIYKNADQSIDKEFMLAQGAGFIGRGGYVGGGVIKNLMMNWNDSEEDDIGELVG